MAGILDSDLTKGIGQLLHEKQLRVPFYQRSYAWKKPQVKELYDDLRRAIDDDREYYFLGSIVGCQDEQKSDVIEIVDGQQRLATTAILLAAIRDRLHDLSDQKLANKFEEQYLFHEKGFRNPVRRPTVRLNDTDDHFFQERVMGFGGRDKFKRPDMRTPSFRLIDDAAHIAASQVKEIVGTRKPNDQKGELDKWVNFIRDRARVIFIVVDDPADAFMIFETLNDRGLDLTVADLTKNYLFMKTGKEHVDTAQDHWARMATTLAASSDAEITKVYIHHLWSSFHGVTRDKELFRDLRDKYDNSTKALNFTKLLADTSTVYAALGNSDSDYWQDYGRHAKRHLAILNSSLKATQVRMLLLAVVDRFSKSDVGLVLTCCVWWSVRFLIAGGSPSKWESHYATRAKSIRDGQIKNAADLIASMDSVVPGDDAFEAAFAEAEVGKAVGRYFLACLEDAALRKGSPHLGQDDPALADREHILPENPDPQNWKHLTKEDHQRLCDRLGNHALLTPEENKKRKNGHFKDARVIYSRSNFVMTQRVGGHAGDWDEEAVQRRQKEMAKMAVVIWPKQPPQSKGGGRRKK